MSYYKLDPETKRVIPTDLDGYVAAHNNHESHIVKQEEVGPWFVSTVFLGLDHAFGWRHELGPIVFETMVFKTERTPEGFRESEDYCERYRTWDEALEGHEKAKAQYALVVQLRASQSQAKEVSPSV